MEIKVTGIADTLTMLDTKGKKDIPRAAAIMLTKVAGMAKIILIKHMNQAFDKPTPYTLSSVYIKSATPENMVAEIFIKDDATKGTPPAKYLGPQVFGGARQQKRSEKLLARMGVIESGEVLVPWKAPLNAFGNVSPGIIQRVLSGLQAQQDPYQQSPEAGQGYKGTRGKRKVKRRYFFRRWDDRTLIFERITGHITPLFASRKSAHYNKRFRFFEVVSEYVPRLMEYEFFKAFSRFMR